MTIIDPLDLGNNQFKVTEGDLSYFAADKAVVTVGAYDSHYQICQILFGKRDGSLYISTPYFGQASGIVSNVAIGNGPPYHLSLHDQGRITSHLVKFSHHPDGRVNFSQDGKVKTEIIRQSFRLDASIGRVFQLHIYWPAGFDKLEITNQKMDRVYLRNVYKGALPNALVIEAEWRRPSPAGRDGGSARRHRQHISSGTTS